jgi:hypothetical protein
MVKSPEPAFLAVRYVAILFVRYGRASRGRQFRDYGYAELLENKAPARVGIGFKSQ